MKGILRTQAISFAAVPAATGPRKDEIWPKLIIQGLPTLSSPNTVQSEVQDFNPGIHLPRPPRWLTTEAQSSKKSASTMILTIVGKDAATKALTSGLSQFGRKFKVQKCLSFGPDPQCNNCLAFRHHTSKCTKDTYRNLCAAEHSAYLYSCGISDCPTKGKQCLTTIKCSNYRDLHQVDFKEYPTYISAHHEATERRKTSD